MSLCNLWRLAGPGTSYVTSQLIFFRSLKSFLRSRSGQMYRRVGIKCSVNHVHIRLDARCRYCNHRVSVGERRQGLSRLDPGVERVAGILNEGVFLRAKLVWTAPWRAIAFAEGDVIAKEMYRGV